MSKEYKDCELKGIILRSLLEGNKTVRQIKESIGYEQNIDWLYQELNFLWRYKYVSRGMRPYRYRLTAKGMKHAYNPLIYKKYSRDHVETKYIVSGNGGIYPENHPENVVDGQPQKIFVPNEIPNIAQNEEVNSVQANEPLKVNTVKLPPNRPSSQPPNPLILEKDAEIARLKAKIKDLELEKFMQINYGVQPPRYVDAKTGTEVPTEQVLSKRLSYQQRKKNLEILAKNRKALALRYYQNNWVLDTAFFKAWENLFPYWIKHIGLWKPSSVEIITPGDKEVRLRDHTKGKLNEKDVLKAQFHIIGMDAKGIWVSGYGMKEARYMSY